jgi:hypothetical protein
MTLEFGFIPGFQQTLQASPAALEARVKLMRTIANGKFTPRLRALVALVVTQESRFDYAIWAQTCVARARRLSGEDIVFASAGTALDAARRPWRALARIIARTGCFDPDEVRTLARDPLLHAPDVLEIVANSALAVLDNYLIQGLAPAKTAAA